MAPLSLQVLPVWQNYPFRQSPVYLLANLSGIHNSFAFFIDNKLHLCTSIFCILTSKPITSPFSSQIFLRSSYTHIFCSFEPKYHAKFVQEHSFYFHDFYDPKNQDDGGASSQLSQQLCTYCIPDTTSIPIWLSRGTYLHPTSMGEQH